MFFEVLIYFYIKYLTSLTHISKTSIFCSCSCKSRLKYLPNLFYSIDQA